MTRRLAPLADRDASAAERWRIVAALALSGIMSAAGCLWAMAH
ncbi:hypothetical protein [Sphingomonas lacunae]|nr:hypothetical protein [Sphingomonas lacunae]